MGKSNKLAGITAVAFMFYIYASIMTDAAYTFMGQQLGDLIYHIVGVFALAFIALTFVMAIKERNKPLLAFFFMMFLIIILAMAGAG